jgi:hypothetical protein
VDRLPKLSKELSLARAVPRFASREGE